MKQLFIATLVFASAVTSHAGSDAHKPSVARLNPYAVELIGADSSRTTLDFYSDNIFRLFRDPKGGIVRDPQANPPARILDAEPRRPMSPVSVDDAPDRVSIRSASVEVIWHKPDGLMQVVDLRTVDTVLSQISPVEFEKGRTRIEFGGRPDEYYYGGGVQNGRFSHKGRSIAIENQNSWTDGGVASPTPFYWSTGGYGIMFHTFAKGTYDFGSKTSGTVSLMHETPYLDMFCMVDDEPSELLADFYQLTGKPVLIPKFGFYEGHLNAYNRDYWAEDTTGKGILFEDGKRYKESQRDNGGVRETLNGEHDYQFSARAVVDRYAAHDLPLGWILPNDGYGAGYGQTTSLDGNISNLREFGDYARSKGVEIGLWTQSDLHPVDSIEPLLQRDIIKEVRDAGVRVLKTDVAWVGWGYSFGLNGVADVGQIMPYYGNDARPFIISLDGWAGTQRYASVWTGDQTGGEWEYIRFHIPTYIGSGLSGQPNVTSDMDGIFGGRNRAVNIRDFQWKTFTPMQLNMDGWGRNEKYPHALGDTAEVINRAYLKLKSQLLPYAYTYAREAVDGKPLMRAMFLEYPNHYTYGVGTRYQYMYGPWLLVAPVYCDTKADSEGNDIRNGIYLPEGRWIDYITGEAYEGGVVLNSIDVPLWKTPVFVRSGAIIPMVNPNNNPSQIDCSHRIMEFFPEGLTSITVYDDDGATMQYAGGNNATTKVTSDASRNGELKIIIEPTQGKFDGFEPIQTTELLVNLTEAPRSVAVRVGGKKVAMRRVTVESELAENTYWYDPAPRMNFYGGEHLVPESAGIRVSGRLKVMLAPADITEDEVEVLVKGFVYEPGNSLLRNTGRLEQPKLTTDTASQVGAYEMVLSWNPVEGADSYEVMHMGMSYTNICDTIYSFGDLNVETPYEFEVRAVNASGKSEAAIGTYTTRRDPLEWAIQNIRGESSSPVQSGFETWRLFDFAESGDMFHTRYGENALPCMLTIDLQSVNTLDRLAYLPRLDGGNGTILSASVSVSPDKIHWTDLDSIKWERNGQAKEYRFEQNPRARYIRLGIDRTVGRYVSGRELYVFKVAGTESWIPGDINSDGRIDENDLTSYANYTGLRRGDSDFEGYVSVGDINGNGLIDAYDISNVATRLGEGVESDDYAAPLAGSLRLVYDRSRVNAGKTVSVEVWGDSLASVNAFSLSIPYDATKWKVTEVDAIGVEGMENLTNDRRHTSGAKALYPTFVNIGERPTLLGSRLLMSIKFEALKASVPDFKATDTLFVDKVLNSR